MNTWIALFRGINVGGNNLLPMKSLSSLIEDLGGSNVQTYIQSGNVVFRAASNDGAGLSKRIVAAVMKAHGFAPRVMLLTRSELKQAVCANPFKHAEAAPKSLHLAFLEEPPRRADLEGLNAIKRADESFALGKRVFYLHTPAGFGDSKLAGRYEKLLGVAATARNWNTVMKLRAMAEESSR